MSLNNYLAWFDVAFLLIYFAVEFGWGGGDKNNGHPPGDMM